MTERRRRALGVGTAQQQKEQSGSFHTLLQGTGCEAHAQAPARSSHAGKRRARSLGIRPLARFVTYAYAGSLPEEMGAGPVYVIPKALKFAGLTLDQIDLMELNEAFAGEAPAVIKTECPIRLGNYVWRYGRRGDFRELELRADQWQH